MEKIITRTINIAMVTIITVKLDDSGKPTTTERVISIPTAHATDNGKADKYIRKNVELEPGEMLAGVRQIDTVGSLFGMTESTFLKYARKVESRDKTTRGTITKEIESHFAHAIVIKPEGNKEEVHAIPDIGDNEKARAWLMRNVYNKEDYVVVTHITTEKALYSLTVADFVNLGRRVVRRNHLEK